MRAKELGPRAEAYFTSCPDEPPPSSNKFFEPAVLAFLSDDFLTPTIGSLLFPDFAQRFFPFPMQAADRTRTFEKSLKSSFRRHFPNSENVFQQPFRSLWDAQGYSPMLMLNTTVVEKGIQAAIAPVDNWAALPASFGPDLDPFFSGEGWPGAEISSRYDVPLSTAVGLSARFTAIASSAVHIDRDYPKRFVRSSNRFVDGGYVDNSGVETALKVTSKINAKSSLFDGSFPGEIVAIPAGFDPQATLLILGGRSIYAVPDVLLSAISSDEIASPVAALNNARGSRAQIAIQRAFADQPSLVVQDSLPWDYYKPPLGWHVSGKTISELSVFVGDAGRCVTLPIEAERAWQTSFERLGASINSRAAVLLQQFFYSLRANHCAACALVRAAQGNDMNNYVDNGCGNALINTP